MEALMGVSSVVTALANTLTGGVVDKALGMIDKLIPDKNLANQLKAQLETLRVTNEHELEMAEVQLAAAQVAVNQDEAKSASVFVAGWRPAVGWTAVAGLSWNYVVAPMVQWIAFLFGVALQGAPTLNISELMGLVSAMLGVGIMRSVDKYNNVATDRMDSKT